MPSPSLSPETIVKEPLHIQPNPYKRLLCVDLAQINIKTITGHLHA